MIKLGKGAMILPLPPSKEKGTNNNMDKIKVHNPNRFDVGIVTASGQSLNIRAKLFALLTQDDIDYLNNLTDFFKRGILRIDAKAPEVEASLYLDQEDQRNFATDEEIIKVLKGNIAKLKLFVDEESDPVLIDKVLYLAKDADLSASKVEYLKTISHQTEL